MSDEPQAEAADDSAADEDAGEDAPAEAADADEEATGLQEGDFVRLDYTVRTVEDERVIDTTREDVAEASEIDTENYEFEPRTVVLGEGHVFQAVDEELVGKEVGDTGTVTVSAAEAFGEFDPDDVRTVSAEKIPEDDRYPGAHVTVDGEEGHVETIIGGRSRVDFNHPLAGENLEYEYEIVGLVDDREERAEGLLEMFIQASPEVWIQTDEVEEETLVEPDEEVEDEEVDPEFETEVVEKETLYIEATPQMTMNQQWLFSKQQIAQQLIDQLDLDRVIVQETIDGMGGMMGGMGGMMGGAGGADIEEALEDVDVDADEIVDELDVDETEE